MGSINGLLSGLFTLIFLPFGNHPLIAMFVLSLLAGVMMLWVFGKLSNQDAIKGVKDQIKGNLIAIRLFQDNLRVVLGAPMRIFWNLLIYLRYAILPVLILIVPFVLILTQLNLYYSVRPLEVGETVHVKLLVKDSKTVVDRVEFIDADGMELDAPPVHMEHASNGTVKGEVFCRVRAKSVGNHTLKFKASSGETIEKQFQVGGNWGATSAVRTGISFWEMLLWPGEAPISSNSWVESIEVQYPEFEMPVFGWNIHWLIWFLVLSILFGYAFKDVLGVQI